MRSCFVVLLLCYSLFARAQEPQSAALFFAISLPDQSGKPVALAAYRGKDRKSVV
jgi:hypothetical protein